MSATERNIQTDIQINARLLQKRRTNERLQLHDGKGGSNDKVGHSLYETIFFVICLVVLCFSGCVFFDLVYRVMFSSVVKKRCLL